MANARVAAGIAAAGSLLLLLKVRASGRSGTSAPPGAPAPGPVFVPRTDPESGDIVFVPITNPAPDEPIFVPITDPNGDVVFVPAPEPVMTPDNGGVVFVPEPQPAIVPEPEPVFVPEPQPAIVPEPEPVFVPEPEPVFSAPEFPIQVPAPSFGNLPDWELTGRLDASGPTAVRFTGQLRNLTGARASGRLELRAFTVFQNDINPVSFTLGPLERLNLDVTASWDGFSRSGEVRAAVLLVAGGTEAWEFGVVGRVP